MNEDDGSVFASARDFVLSHLKLDRYDAERRLVAARRELLYESPDPVLRTSIFLDRFWTPERRANPGRWINRDE